MKIIIIASDIHSGGGKTLLNDFLSAASKMNLINFHVLVDQRYDSKKYFQDNIFFTFVSKFQRIFYVNRTVKKLANEDDIIINFSDLPTFSVHKATTIQYIQNQYLIDNLSTKGLHWFVRLRLLFEKIAFSIFLRNSDYLFIQNLVMQDLLLNLGFSKNIIKVMPFKDIEQVASIEKKLENSFLYVASDDSHKNHSNLIAAWKLLAKQGNYPTLILTIDGNTFLHRQITEKIKKYNLQINIESNLSRLELLGYYNKVSALIYPSFFESLGLPLIEASNFNLPVIASELDYVRDLIDPTETFDPNSPRSIARAVNRFMGNTDNKTRILSAVAFSKDLATYAEK
jgi:glycosyltransferase involved in cell wall biosynthesis